MTITDDCYCWSLPEYYTTLTVGVYDHYYRLLLLVTARVRYHSYTVGVLDHYHRLLLLVTARVRYNSYSGNL